MAVDILSILQSGKRSFSFLSQCVGLMADLDLGTEHLRWMGSNRFIYGYLRGSKYLSFCVSTATKRDDLAQFLLARHTHLQSPSKLACRKRGPWSRPYKSTPAQHRITTSRRWRKKIRLRFPHLNTLMITMDGPLSRDPFCSCMPEKPRS
jgi:hypothetical protein